MNTGVDYHKLYKMTQDVTPLEGDCGQLCNSICCRPNEDNTIGMYLFPGEECMFTGNEDWLVWEKVNPKDDDFPPSWDYPVYFIKCTQPCPREKRPLSCRLFPLAPHILSDKRLLLIHESIELPYSCPIIANTLLLREEFVETVASSWLELIKDKRILDLVIMDSREREREGHIPRIIWWGDSLSNLELI